MNLPDDVPIEAKMVTATPRARRPRSSSRTEVRKNVLKYDEVMNQQRKVICQRAPDDSEGENLQKQAQ